MLNAVKPLYRKTNMMRGLQTSQLSFVAFVAVAATARAFSVSLTASQQGKMEDVVRRYFDGVNKKDPDQIKSCFEEEATIRDVCGMNDAKRSVRSQDLADRCMDFLAAHPDCKVDFHYGPTCGRDSRWVVAHWYETGTWSGDSCGIPAKNVPMRVEGQTRFFISEGYKIIDMVVTRTFTDWEEAMLEKNTPKYA